MFYVYVIRSLVKNNFIYVGYSTDLKKRFSQHNSKTSQSTKCFAPYKLIFYESYEIMSDAKRREKYLKTNKGRKTLKLMLQDYFLTEPIVKC